MAGGGVVSTCGKIQQHTWKRTSPPSAFPLLASLTQAFGGAKHPAPLRVPDAGPAPSWKSKTGRRWDRQ